MLDQVPPVLHLFIPLVRGSDPDVSIHLRIYTKIKRPRTKDGSYFPKSNYTSFHTFTTLRIGESTTLQVF